MVTLDLSRFCLPLRNTRPQNRGLRSWEFEIWLKKHVGDGSAAVEFASKQYGSGEKWGKTMEHHETCLYYNLSPKFKQENERENWRISEIGPCPGGISGSIHSKPMVWTPGVCQGVLSQHHGGSDHFTKRGLRLGPFHPKVLDLGWLNQNSRTVYTCLY